MKSLRIYVRNIFIAGVLATLPIVITVALIRFIFEKFSGILFPLFEKLSVKYGIILPPPSLQILSFSLVILAILFIGMMAKNYFGNKMLKLVERMLSRIPIVKSIYNVIRQIVEAFQNSGGGNFKKVILFEYPRKGMYHLGFITKDSTEVFNEKIGQSCVNVFVPTTPNPTSGFIIILPKEEVIELDITVEQGVKFIISAGLVEPVKVNGETKIVVHEPGI